MSIYEQIGGQPVVKTAVTLFYNRVLEDPALAPWFDGVDLSRLRSHQRAFLSAALGGPEAFTGRSLAAAHSGRAITDEAFDAVVHHLGVALRDLGIDHAVIAAIAERLETLRPEIVARGE